MEQNFWNNSKTEDYPQVTENIDCDVAIIGGGLAGVMCAEALKDSGLKICIFEANKICGGESANSSAMITYAHDLIYNNLTKKHGMKIAEKYYQLNKGAQQYIENLATRLDCDYRHCDLIYFATTKNGSKLIDIERDVYKKMNNTVPKAENCELPFPVANTLTIPSQGCLNPQLFIQNLCAELNSCGVGIYEHSRAITQPKNHEVMINEFTIKAKYFIIATHFPYINAPGFYFIKMYQSRRRNSVYNTNLRLNNMYECAEDNGFEYRPTEKGTLCGGCDTRTGRYKNDNYYNILDTHMAAKFMTTENDTVAHFSAQDCITFDHLPFVGKYAKSMPNVYVVTGFNKWGFTNSVVSANIIADLIQGKAVDNIYKPNRIYAIKSPISELRNIACDVAGFAGNLTTTAKNLASVQVGEGKIIKYKGEKLGIYRRDDGGIDAIKASCPHMGCALKWNSTEKTWDCPCHGSRFDTKGNILASPTVKSAEYKEI